VKVIAKLASQYGQQDVAEALMKHCTERERSEVYFVGTYLDDVWQINREAEKAAEPRCCECGRSVREWKDDSGGYARSDARYCSAGCRQKAYRKRVTDRLFADILGAGLHRLRAPPEFGRCLLGRAHERIERHPGLLDALFGRGAQIGGNFKVGNSALVVNLRHPPPKVVL
jgi:hypothetical protein